MPLCLGGNKNICIFFADVKHAVIVQTFPCLVESNLGEC